MKKTLVAVILSAIILATVLAGLTAVADFNMIPFQMIAFIETIDESQLDSETKLKYTEFVLNLDLFNATQEDFDELKEILAGAPTLPPTAKATPSPTPAPTPVPTPAPTQPIQSQAVEPETFWDFSSMDDDSFISVWHDAQIEYMRRASSFRTVLGIGAYEVGRDIAAGSYTLFITKDANFGIVVYPDWESYTVGNSKDLSELVNDKSKVYSVGSWSDSFGDRYDVSLHNGNVLVIRSAPALCVKGGDFSYITGETDYEVPAGPGQIYCALQREGFRAGQSL